MQVQLRGGQDHVGVGLGPDHLNHRVDVRTPLHSVVCHQDTLAGGLVGKNLQERKEMDDDFIHATTLDLTFQNGPHKDGNVNF